jgi:hypothetical protein
MDVLHDITDATAVSDFTVHVTFDTGETGMFDCSPYLSHPYWRRLADPAFFRLVRVAYGTLVWSADIDIAPEDVGEKAVCDPVPASLTTYHDAMVPHSAPEL